MEEDKLPEKDSPEQNPIETSETEPSVLDYVMSKLPWAKKQIVIPDVKEMRVSEETDEVEVKKVEKSKTSLPFLALIAVLIALIAQRTLEPGTGEREWLPGLLLYLVAGGFLVWALVKQDIQTPFLYEESQKRVDQGDIRWIYLVMCLVFSSAAFITFRDNTFTVVNLFFWGLAIVSGVVAFWKREADELTIWEKVKQFFMKREWEVKITPWHIAVLIVIILVVFFRVSQLDAVPSQMISDQAEKLFDVEDVMNGKYSIFFPRNTGREAIQFYLTALINVIRGTGPSFINLKIGTVLIGLFTLPFLYLLGKEVGSKRIGLFAVLFAGIAYWPNLISRFGLRYPLYPMFAAPALYYLIRGLRTMRRNDFILSGIFLGIGLHGYSPFRVVPIILVIVVGVYMLHRQSRQFRLQALQGLLILAFISLLVFLPLLRYSVENPESVSYRALTRLSTLEREIPGNSVQIFFSNMWNALTSLSWDDGEVWVISVVHRPMLDVVSAALVNLGVIFVLVRYIRKRHWLDLFLLLAIPLLMMPSILSLAFPGENPCLNRTSGAIIPVFLIIGIFIDSLIDAITKKMKTNGSLLAGALVVLLVGISCMQNYDLVFNQYKKVFDQSSWNSSEMGEVIKDFTKITGSADTAWIVGYPYWVDTRAVMINAGYVRDNGIWADDFENTLNDPRAKLFLVNLSDFESLTKLQELYPDGYLQRYISAVETKDFWIFTVPPQQKIEIESPQ